MSRFLAVIMLCGVGLAQLSFAGTGSQPDAAPQSAFPQESSSGALSALPSLPKGKSTVIGGSIRDVDHVRDQMTLKVFGGGNMKILFDPRTHFYRNGIRTPLRDLRSDEHASVETVLDGTNIYALSVHVLSKPPEGECQCQVLKYDSGTRELTVSAALTGEPIVLRVPADTPVVRVGQAASSSANSLSSDLVKGTLISIEFQSNGKGRGIAKNISVLASPGSAFVFTGNITFLDLQSGTLALLDPRNGKNYRISFDPARFPVSQHLHQGARVTVTADFDGSHYEASAITVH